MTSTSEVLNRAADLIEERGWISAITGSEDLWGESGGPMCLEGGIMAAAGIERRDQTPKCPAYHAVWDYLQNDQRWGVFRTRLFDWNDTYGRTAAEVIEVLRATAVIEAARENADEPAALTEAAAS